MTYGSHTRETHMLLRHKSHKTISNPNKFELVFDRLGPRRMTSIFPHTNQTNN